MEVWVYCVWLGALGHCLALLSLLKASRKSEKTLVFPAVSIVITTRQEIELVIELLERLPNLDYPAPKEVILALDRTPLTGSLLKTVQKCTIRGLEVRILCIAQNPANWSPRKWALQKGIEAAQYDWLAFTDSDCRPGPLWLQALFRSRKPETEILLGFSPYVFAPSVLNAIIQFETAHTAFLYGSAAALGLPYMGVGRNMAFSKKWFEQNQPFLAHSGILAGSDDLLVNRFARGRNTQIVLNPGSLVESLPPLRWFDWFGQKKRHTSVARYYTLGSKVGLIFFYLLVFLCLNVPLLFFLGVRHGPLLLGFIFFLFFRYFALGYIFFLFRSVWLLPLLPLLDIIYQLYLLIVPLFGILSKTDWTSIRKK